MDCRKRFNRIYIMKKILLIASILLVGCTSVDNHSKPREAIKQTYDIDAWLLTLGAVTEPKDNSRDVIRSIYPTYRLHEETNVSPY